MNIKELRAEQFEELREKLAFCYKTEELEAVGANHEIWTNQDIEDWINNDITDELVIKSFEHYDFVEDDFFCTASKGINQLAENIIAKGHNRFLVNLMTIEELERTRDMTDKGLENYMWSVIAPRYGRYGLA